MSHSVRHDVAWGTHIGKTHRVNQDCGGAWTWIRPNGVAASLVLVADGVSSGRHSEDASRLAMECVHNDLAPLLAGTANLEEITSILLESARQVNATLAQRPHDTLANADATTLACAVVVGEDGATAWVGDSRVYLVDQASIHQVTRDHSWASEMVESGAMSLDEAAKDPRSHMITRWLGPPQRPDPGTETRSIKAHPGTYVVCCSDGLHGSLSVHPAGVADMSRVLCDQPDDLTSAVDVLVALAMQRGGSDDVTAAVIAVR